MITVIILTLNEELHIARAIESVLDFASDIFVVDSGSTDRTTEIAQSLGAKVLVNPWRNYASQFNWALEQLPCDTEWIMRLDADEIVTAQLRAQIMSTVPKLSDEISGIVVGRRMTFLERPIRYGGLFPIRVIRLFRRGEGRCEDRWMDEHIMVSGKVISVDGEIIDDNLNNLTWWTEKHNSYASREVVDLLNLEYDFMQHDTVASLRGGQAGLKRFLKERVYTRLPAGLRACAYFFYRYFLRVGFLDGQEGFTFHVLQGFWYRFLVDAKLTEVRRYMIRSDADAPTAIREVLGIEVRR